MSNNRMYIKIGENKLLIAKGWGLGKWQVYNPDDLVDRLQGFFDKEGEYTLNDDLNIKHDCCVDYKIIYESDEC